MFSVNVLLWIIYLFQAFRNFRMIIREKLWDQVHGGILLTCVTTQSIVIAGSSLFGSAFPSLGSVLLISLGIRFFMLSALC
ncbi:hypothetical protein skT53_22340 [Effusibacillus dendaii]|uniref:Uncharacterized protein n=1 Tax=Effusibacillus dendaii TaxID=2743772 RepID=A0A7I8DE70_9BACL|nr:hypothetical protein skT53_22340 [Effusibacillus dendaii]